MSKEKWNIKLLKNEKCFTAFQLKLHSELSKLKKSQPAEQSIEKKWTNLSSCLKGSARSTLTSKRKPLTPTRKKALDRLQKAKFATFKDRTNTLAQKEYEIALQERREVFVKKEHQEIQEFFDNLNEHDPQVRTRLTFKFLKRYRQQANKSKQKANIPLSSWEAELQSACTAQQIRNISETDHWPLGPPPSEEQINSFLRRMRNGTAPGVDAINIELLKSAPEPFISELTALIGDIWINNEIPSEWLTTVQIPIPKKARPTSISDFRRITLCSVAYKLYTMFILDQIFAYFEVPLYQAGFQRNRSTDDQIFVVKRILEERWRKGLTTYVLAIDLKQAFDKVQHKDLATILSHYGVPRYLINRIITACLTEETMVQSEGRCTTRQRKTIGVKQGCPLSPNLFVLVLHAILETVAEALGNYDLSGTNISLPFLLAYADDLLLLADNMQDLHKFIDEFSDVAQEVGLSINPQKCELLIRNPNNPETNHPPSLPVGRFNITRVNKLKYLGVYLTNNLNRPMIVRERIKTAYKIAHSLLPFLREHSLPLALIQKIYETTIAPVATYGLKASAMTRRNRISLTNMERQILRILSDTATDRPSTIQPKTMLRNKTIVKRVMVNRLRYHRHIERRPNNHILRVARRFKINKNFKVGRPCFIWEDTLRIESRKTETNHLLDTMANDYFNMKDVEQAIYDGTISEEEE